MGTSESSRTNGGRYQLESPRSPNGQVIPRRFPRIGSNFQTRLGKSTEPLDRPIPDQMSTEYPHTTEYVVHTCRSVSQTKDFPGNGRETGHTSNIGDNSQAVSTSTRRGGTRVHAPSRDLKRFTLFVQPFVTCMGSEPKMIVTPQAWVQHMVHLHSTGGAGKRKRNQRGSTKRKRDSEEELVWSLENLLQGQQEARRRKKLPNMHNGEEEATAMEYFALHFHGHAPTALLNITAEMSGGQALKAMKCDERRWASQRPKGQSTNGSNKWRILYERTAFADEPSLLRQLQDESCHQYNVDTHDKLEKNDKFDQQQMEITLDSDDLKGAWTSTLACGKSIERQLNGELPDKRKPLLSTLLSFVGNSYRLPIPESCFGTHHVVIEEVSSNIIFILLQIQRAQKVQAIILDKVFNESGEGIDSDALLKFLDTECGDLPVKLPEAEQLYESRSVVVEWERRLASLLDTKDNDTEDVAFEVSLEEAEHFREEAKSHGYLSKSFVQLTGRIQRAYDLRTRIVQWKCTTPRNKGSLKTLQSLVKETNRVKLGFPEAMEVIEYDFVCQSWVDRANVATRSKTSLIEIQALVRETEEIPIDLSDYVEKLETRVRTAEKWLEALQEVVPFREYGEEKLEWMKDLDLALRDVDQISLHELSSEGNRIPVIVNEATMLQVAFDAKTWTIKAKRWTPHAVDGKRGKLSDLREHLEKLRSLRDRLPLSSSMKKAWSPDGEKEVSDIVNAADSWHEKFQNFLGGSDESSNIAVVPIEKLRELSNEADQIFAILGHAASKIKKVLAESEIWYSSHSTLLRRCGLVNCDNAYEKVPQCYIELCELESAVQDAESNLSVEIQEVSNLRDVLERVVDWRRQVSLIAPKRSKRSGKIARSKLTLFDLMSLVERSTDIPIDTTDEVNRLQVQLSTIEAWRYRVSSELESIVDGFEKLQTRISNVYGDAESFGVDFYAKSNGADSDAATERGSIDSDPMDSAEGDLDDGDDFLSWNEESGLEVFRQIRVMQEGARDICVTTAEGDLGDALEAVAEWLIRSMKYLASPKEIFDKRFFGAFDRFLSEGRDLLDETTNKNLRDSDTQEKVCGVLGIVVSGQLQRLETLQREREAFKEWCRAANLLLADEKRLSSDTVSDLARQSRRFPAVTDLISKVRGLSARSEKWSHEAREVLESERKMSVHDVQDLLGAGERLNVKSNELKLLKEKLDRAQNWLNSVSAYTRGEIDVDVDAVNDLIQEHMSLIVELPEELEELRQTVVGYCLCRRPYEGFMIGCDHCDEWYHGSCIGVSESKAGKVEKFSCVRCELGQGARNSALAAIGLVKKWTCNRDLKRARQIDYQRIQRRFRKEKKDIEKQMAVIKEAEQQLGMILNGPGHSGSINNPGKVAEGKNCSLESPAPEATIVCPIIGEASSSIFLGSDELPQGMADTSPKDSDVHSPSFPPSEIAGNAGPFYSDQSVSIGREQDLRKADEAGNKQRKPMTKEEIETKMMKAKVAVSEAQERLEMISNQSRRRKLIEARENEQSSVLRRWMLHVRDNVLVPSDLAIAEKARPPFGVVLSQPMLDAIQFARTLGIEDLPDISDMENYFKCVSWNIMAATFLRRKPSVEEVKYIIDRSELLNLPDERALRTLRYMANRAYQLQSRSRKALAPKKGETRSISVSLLQDIHKAAEESPLRIPEMKLLRAAIDDKGLRHCICGGPNDALEMLQCDKCKNRFHKACVGAPAGLIDETWLCQPCGGKEGGPLPAVPFSSISFTPVQPPPLEGTTSAHAPDPKKLWPPFGLLGSKEATEVLGPECSAIPVVFDVLTGEQNKKAHVSQEFSTGSLLPADNGRVDSGRSHHKVPSRQKKPSVVQHSDEDER